MKIPTDNFQLGKYSRIEVSVPITTITKIK